MMDRKFDWPLTAGDLKYVLGYPGEACYVYPDYAVERAVYVRIDSLSGKPDVSDPLSYRWQIELNRYPTVMRYQLDCSVLELLDSLATGEIAAQARAMWHD